MEAICSIENHSSSELCFIVIAAPTTVQGKILIFRTVDYYIFSTAKPNLAISLL